MIGDRADGIDYDIALVFNGLWSAESEDRPTIEMRDEDLGQFLKKTKTGDKKAILIANVPGPTVIKNRDLFDSILVNFYSGERLANSLMDIIEGRVNPSGKLPVTFPNVPNEQNMTVEQFPGVNNISHYSEGLFMGYRWYDKHNVNPAFPFGHGLTYT